MEQRAPRKKCAPLVTTGIFCLLVFAAMGSANNAEKRIAVEKFASIKILDAGRIKPLDTYARSTLLQFSGRQFYRGEDAIDWFARVIFTPESAVADAIFLCNNPEIADAIGIKPEKHRRYSFMQLMPGISSLRAIVRKARQTESSKQTEFGLEAIRLSTNIDLFMHCMAQFDFAYPEPQLTVVDSAVSAYLGFPAPGIPISFFDLLSRKEKLKVAMAGITGRPWSSFDSSIVKISKAMYQYIHDSGPVGFCVIPMSAGGDGAWVNPWTYLQQGGVARNDTLLNVLLNMRTAFAAGEQAEFNRAVEIFNAQVANHSSKTKGSIGLEVLYNRTAPFSKAKIIYGVCTLGALLVLLTGSTLLKRMLFGFLGLALVFHTGGILARVFIMARPPVTNLYETFVFVSWACAVSGVILEVVQKKSLGLFITSLTGWVFLYVSGKWALDGDTLGMLAAVLNNNFWLLTHIITIALGYAGLSVAGVIGHIFLVQLLFRADAVRLSSTEKSLYGFLVFGLLFTFLGTMLGGMWADQAWGRFWGWDPKENGELLIILWNAALLHARAGGMIRGIGTAVSSIVGLMLVMFAWIGVNLLGVGLHSYGFTSTGASSLAIFIGAEIVFLLLTSSILYKKK